MMMMRVWGLLVVGCCLCTAAPSQPSAGSGRNKLLLISFDGFRWDYDRMVDTPNLDKMAQDGVKARYVTPPPFVTITSPSHFSIVTGTGSNESFSVQHMQVSSSKSKCTE
uniref:Uncharacterized protein n=1 Tax=Knipowitschia caucasica TaxID=637954 RepID=A0AAV2LGD3_KNICA